MARSARLVVPGLPHHVVQRGNRRLDVFFTDDDRLAYLALLRRACVRAGVQIWAYCLMRNHVHLIAVPVEEDSLARCFSDAHIRYTRRVNARHEWQGHLWQARFGSSVLDERYLLAAVRYVERNPVQAGIARLPWHYRWSSAAWHMGRIHTDPLVSGDESLRDLVRDWKVYLRSPEDPIERETIEQETRVNRPLGSEEFIQHLESRFGRSLTRGKPGPRPEQKSVAVPDSA